MKSENQTHSIGVYFDGKSICGVRIRPHDDCVEVMSSASVECADLSDLKASRPVLRKLLARLTPPQGCKVYVVAEFDQFFTTHLSIGDAPLAQMNHMVQMAYQQEINLEDVDLIFDYERVGMNSDAVARKVNLHVFSVERSRVDILTELFKAAGVTINGLFPPLFAFRNLIDSEKQTEPTALLILERNELRIGVVHNEKYTFTRTFKSGQDAFLDYISQKTKRAVSLDMLEKALSDGSEKDIPSGEVEIREAFSFITDRMLHQIERAFKFYTGRLKLPSIANIQVYAHSSVIAEQIAALMRLAHVQPVSALSIERLSFIDAEEPLTGNDLPSFTLATGTALAAYVRSPNLLMTHQDQLQHKRAYRIRTVLMLVLSGMALVCISSFLFLMALTTPRVLQRRALEERAKAYPLSLTQELIGTKTMLCSKRMMSLRELSRHYALQGYFYEICRLLPPEIELEQLHVELSDDDESDVAGTLSLQGIVTDQGLRKQALLTKFLVETGNSPLFRNVNRSSVSESEMAVYRDLGVFPFKVSCELVFSESEGTKGGEQ